MLRKDVYRIDIQDNLHFLIFHKIVPKGFGSAVSLYVNNYEFLKFDCLGENKGHYHIYDDISSKEINFTEKTCEQQINRTCELLNNVNEFLHKSNRNDIRNFKIDMNIFVSKLEEVKNKMLEYEYNFYSKLR